MKNSCLIPSVAAIAVASALVMPNAGVAATSSDYVLRDHLLIHWDGIDNAGTGTHNPAATQWKNIAPGATAYDLTLTANGAWTNGNAMSVNGASATYDGGAAPSAKTIEVVFKMAQNKSSLMLFGGNQTTRQLVAFAVSGNETKCYLEGLSGVAHPTVNWNFDPDAIRSVAATFTNPGQAATTMFADGVARTDGSHTSGWTLSSQKIVLGAYDTKFPWVGEVYAIRMYDCVLSPGQIAINHAIDLERFAAKSFTSADYVQEGLVAHWDGIDNVSTGTHDGTATTWRNLAATGSAYDLSLTGSGAWNAEGNALSVSDLSAVGQSAAPEYKTIEVVFRQAGKGRRFLFASGDKKRVVLFDNDNTAYFSGVAAKGGSIYTKCIQEPFTNGVVRFLAARYDDDGAVADIFKDAVRRDDGNYQNSWNPSGVISIGNRDTSYGNTYAWVGEVYAIRLYSRRLTKAELARNHLIDSKRFLTSSSYVRENLLAYWDGIDNAGTGVHDNAAVSWKNLVTGGRDLAIYKAEWTSSSLRCLGKPGTASLAARAADGTGTLSFKAFEAVFANGANGEYSTVVFSGGYLRYFVLGTSYAMWKNNERSTAINNQAPGRMSLAWLQDSKKVQANGEQIQYGDQSGTWDLTGIQAVHVGGKYADHRYSYNGDLYALRAYGEEPTAAQTAFNYKVDRARFGLPPVAYTWSAVGDGFFATNGNWSAGLATQGVPGPEDAATLAAGNYVATLDDEWVVGSLSVGSGAMLALSLPQDGNAPDGAVPLTVMEALSAEAGAGLLLEANAFNRKHHGENATLIECGEKSADALQILADALNASLCSNRASVSADGKRLIYTAPSAAAFVITVREHRHGVLPSRQRRHAMAARIPRGPPWLFRDEAGLSPIF